MSQNLVTHFIPIPFIIPSPPFQTSLHGLSLLTPFGSISSSLIPQGLGYAKVSIKINQNKKPLTHLSLSKSSYTLEARTWTAVIPERDLQESPSAGSRFSRYFWHEYWILQESSVSQTPMVQTPSSEFLPYQLVACVIIYLVFYFNQVTFKKCLVFS